jgi:hypothetical protein
MSYAFMHPEIGYCQGMGMMAAILLLNMEEHEAYWTFSALVNNRMPKGKKEAEGQDTEGT